MSRQFSFVFLALLFFSACQNPSPSQMAEAQPITMEDGAEEVLASLSLEEKVGQLFMIGFYGPEPNYYLNKMIKQRNVGGVLLMKYNMDNRDQTLKMLETIQTTALSNGPAIPLWFSIDQEGGVVTRAKLEGMQEFTAQKDIQSSSQATAVAQRRAKELSDLGIHINFAPVVEYIQDTTSFLAKRVFRVQNREAIPALAGSMVKAYTEGGIIAVPKHFPGHTDQSMDSHEGLPVEPLSADSLQALVTTYADLMPYQPQMIMTSHVMYPAVDSVYPATLSKTILDYLREDLAYEGLIITDDMEMQAMESNYAMDQAVVTALKAGVDILLFSSTPQKQANAYNAVVQAVKEGDLSEALIDEKVLRVLRLKQQYVNP
jgi:beta-N-acetylhexosaminidase